jgi:hypothetical protein
VGRYREYSSDADRQRAYRERKAEELRRLRAGTTPASKRRQVSERLVKVLGMLGSAHAGERNNAARTAVKILKEAKLTWYDILDVAPKK